MITVNEYNILDKKISIVRNDYTVKHKYLEQYVYDLGLKQVIEESEIKNLNDENKKQQQEIDKLKSEIVKLKSENEQRSYEIAQITNLLADIALNFDVTM